MRIGIAGEKTAGVHTAGRWVVAGRLQRKGDIS